MDYYFHLADQLDLEDPVFNQNIKAVQKGLVKAGKTLRQNIRQWDRDATPVISALYLHLERLLAAFP